MKPDPSQKLQLSFSLRRPGLSSINFRLSSRNSVHASRDETDQLRRSDPADLRNVLAWLSAHGINETTTAKGWIHGYATVETTEKLLDADLRHYAFDGGATVIRTMQYSVPDWLSRAISFVHPISNFMMPKHSLAEQAGRRDPSLRWTLTDSCRHDKFANWSEKTGSEACSRGHSSRRGSNVPCSTGTTPECIRELYRLPAPPPHGESTIRFGVAGFDKSYANFADVNDFLQQYAPRIHSAGYSFSTTSISGGGDPQSQELAGLEAQTDLEYSIAIGYPTRVAFYSTGGQGEQLNRSGELEGLGSDSNEPYITLLEYLLDLSDSQVPHVLSISYGDSEDSVPRAYAELACYYFGLLASRGTSILASSGDGGSQGNPGSGCVTDNGQDERVTMAVFPGTCPFVTAVGSVMSTVPSPFQGAVFSGGGFSQLFPQPTWQASDVGAYVRALDGHLEQYYNPTMRALPDLSVIGTGFEVVSNGRRSVVMGTSTSTPVFAAMVALVDDARARKGKPSLGWLNPLLYSTQLRDVFTDVTKGESMSCRWNSTEPGGWPAKRGWDAMTGLGVPADYERLTSALLDV